ncbi:hypothetical protein DFR24_2519 [Panacagrimonas perspica]|uniref:Uncharacterized protein n=1 Tax=Panacagrimonas perspica TaxID=381431 RepID=A0A4R7P331_9GAMM|nr:hypothetical protein DFR24_2519 [Panacagrimonas perspica]
MTIFMQSSMSVARLVRLALLTAAFAVACGMPDSLDTVIGVFRVLFLES